MQFDNSQNRVFIHITHDQHGTPMPYSCVAHHGTVRVTGDNKRGPNNIYAWNRFFDGNFSNSLWVPSDMLDKACRNVEDMGYKYELITENPYLASEKQLAIGRYWFGQKDKPLQDYYVFGDFREPCTERSRRWFMYFDVTLDGEVLLNESIFDHNDDYFVWNQLFSRHAITTICKQINGKIAWSHIPFISTPFIHKDQLAVVENHPLIQQMQSDRFGDALFTSSNKPELQFVQVSDIDTLIEMSKL